ncbi:oligosaccharide flippase family protein [Natronococcus wangiae]|uniref:oligosaccharide flippase family protein n=1 Tax=Natronococcus wangiae TaxID=3068275 RepID=UPI00273F3D24|nr:oligosaccharide flippase family protein [Natronococcus sp. AD5]
MATSLKSAIFSAFLSKTTILLLSVLFTPLLVRLLGPTRYGQYAVVVSVYAVVSTFTTDGTAEALRKYISENPDERWQTAVLSAVFRPAVGLSLVAAVGFVLAARTGLAARAFGDPFTSLFYLLGAYAVARQLRIHVMWALMGLQLESKSEPLRVLRKLLFVTLSLGLVYLGFGVEGVLVADIVTNAIVSAVGFLFLARELPLRPGTSAPHPELPKRQFAEYSVHYVFFGLFLMSLYHVDVLLLQTWRAEEIVGYYRGALAIAEVLWLAPFAVQFALIQRVSQDWRKGNIDAIQQTAARVTNYVFLFTTLLSLGIAALAADFVPLYLGDSFSPAIVPLLLLLPGVLGFAVARPALAINQGRRSLRPLIAATGACSLVNLVLNLLLIPPYGMAGAAVATSIGYGSLVVFQSIAARRLGYEPLTGIRPRPTLLTIGATAIVIFPLARIISSSVLALVVVPPLGAIVYATALISTGAVTREELAAVLEGIDPIPDRFQRGVVSMVDRIPKVGD